MSEKVKVTYQLDKKTKTRLVIIAENKGVHQSDLINEYINAGIEKDKEFLSSHLDE